MWLYCVVALDSIIYPAHGGGERGFKSCKVLGRPSTLKVGYTTSFVYISGYINPQVDIGEVLHEVNVVLQPTFAWKEPQSAVGSKFSQTRSRRQNDHKNLVRAAALRLQGYEEDMRSPFPSRNTSSYQCRPDSTKAFLLSQTVFQAAGSSRCVPVSFFPNNNAA